MQFQHPFAVITPSADGDVLAVLAGATAWFSASTVSRMVPTRSLEGIRLVLNRLADQGIVEREVVGNGHRFRLNRDHLAAEPIVLLANQWRTFLDRLTRELESWQTPPTYAAVFGSAARREMTLSSDIDLFLVRTGTESEDEWYENVASLESRATLWTGNDARVLWMEESEVTDRALETVVQDIVREGIAVIGDPSWLRGAVRRGRGATDPLHPDEHRGSPGEGDPVHGGRGGPSATR